MDSPAELLQAVREHRITVFWRELPDGEIVWRAYTDEGGTTQGPTPDKAILYMVNTLKRKGLISAGPG